MINMTYDPRAALEVRRYHTWRMHRPQSVGEHTAQVLRIMLTIWPDCPRNLLIYAVTHDMGEMAGDVPYPFKNMIPRLNEGMKLAETHVLATMSRSHGAPPLVALTGFERTFFKACDYLDCLEAALVENNMGNMYAVLVADRMTIAIEDLGLDDEVEYRDVVESLKAYVKRRTEQEEIK